MRKMFLGLKWPIALSVSQKFFGKVFYLFELVNINVHYRFIMRAGDQAHK